MRDEFSFYEISVMTDVAPLICLKEFRNLRVDFNHSFGWTDDSPLNINTKLDRDDAELLITHLTRKNVLNLLLASKLAV